VDELGIVGQSEVVALFDVEHMGGGGQREDQLGVGPTLDKASDRDGEPRDSADGALSTGGGVGGSGRHTGVGWLFGWLGR